MGDGLFLRKMVFLCAAAAGMAKLGQKANGL